MDARHDPRLVPGAVPPIKIKIPTGDDEFERAYRFHLENVGNFLFPRDEESLRKLVEGFSAFVAMDGDQIIGLCYVAAEEGGDEVEWKNRWEFGGVVVHEKCHGRGIASALGTVALANQFIQEYEAVASLDGGLIATRPHRQ